MRQKGNAAIALIIVAALVILFVGAFYSSGSRNSAQPSGAAAGPTLPGEYSELNGVTTWVKTGSCNTASTTAAVIANPFGASSTVSIRLLKTANATTTTLLVGTTTKSSGLASSDISATLVNTTAATNTAVYLKSGVTVGIPTSGTGTFTSVGIGAGEKVAIFATSTATGAGAAGYAQTGCTYKAEFVR